MNSLKHKVQHAFTFLCMSLHVNLTPEQIKILIEDRSDRLLFPVVQWKIRSWGIAERGCMLLVFNLDNVLLVGVENIQASKICGN